MLDVIRGWWWRTFLFWLKYFHSDLSAAKMFRALDIFLEIV